MIIKEINEGTKVAYEVSGNKIFFGDDELMLNLSKYERDYEVIINICNDDNGILIAGLSKYFVANIIIPARAYVDGKAQPFDMDKVELDLWALVDIPDPVEAPMGLEVE